MKTQFEISRATTKDLNDTVELGKRLCFEMQKIDPISMDLKKGFEKEIRKWQASNVNNKEALFLKAVVNNKTVGYLFCEIQNKLPIFKSNPGHIHDLYVLPEYRDRGIGSALLSKAVKWFRGKGIKRATMDTLTKNSDAIRMYERMDFVGYRLKMRSK